MKTALIIHGKPSKEEYYSRDYPSGSNFHWLPWLQKELLIAGYLAQAPEMPTPYEPVYSEWKETFEQFRLSPESILVGHSCGAGFLLKYLSENPIKVKRTVLVAPYLDPEHTIQPRFFDFKIDASITERTDLHMLYTDNDMQSVMTSIEMIKNAIPNIQSKLFSGYGHFCLDDMKTEEFPELKDLLIAD